MRRILLVLALVAGLLAAADATAQPDPGTSVSATTFTVPLSGPGGSGTAFLAINPGGKVCYVITVALTTPGDVPQEPAPGLGNAHIHDVPTGGIAIHLDSTFTALGDGMFIAADCVRGDKDVVRDVLAHPDQYYVNVHTASFLGGAVSGTLA
jgi:CHRD domain